jgi:hypothetical protein
VTKQNCVTLWETDEAGRQVTVYSRDGHGPQSAEVLTSSCECEPQVWAGNEACEPVTWQECQLVPKNVKFIVPEINCTDGNELWYHEPEAMEDIRMTNTFTCEVGRGWIIYSGYSGKQSPLLVKVQGDVV